MIPKALQKERYDQHLLDFQVEGGEFIPPTTSSTQITGAGASDYNVDQREIHGELNGIQFDVDGAADVSLDASGSNILTSGQARWYASVLAVNLYTGAVSKNLVKGTIAAYASVNRVTQAQIQAAIGDNWDYVVLAESLCYRSADTVITQTYKNSRRYFTDAQEADV